MSSVQFIFPDWKVPAQIKACTTTRLGGFSQGDYQSCNLSVRVGDVPANVIANRNRLKAALSLPDTPVWLEQVHGNRVIDISESSDLRADAAVCFVPDKVCVVLTADCLPIFFCNCEGDRVSIAHAGWRGLVSGIIQATVQALKCDPAQLAAWIGPCIGAHSYSVDDAVRTAFLQQNKDHLLAFLPDHNGTWAVDLCQIAHTELHRCGVMRVSGSFYCTYTDQRRFYSFRRDGTTGRMANLIWLSRGTY